MTGQHGRPRVQCLHLADDEAADAAVSRFLDDLGL